MKPYIGVFVGDLHVGGDTALCKPGFPVGSKDKRPYQPSANQQWLFEQWQNFYNTIKQRCKGHLVFVGLGGDLVDGVQHHDTTQTWGNHDDQRAMAIDLLKPLVGLADHAYGLLGTAAHVGDQGDEDAAIYTALHVDYDHRWQLNIGGRVLWWAHHGLPVGTREHTLENGAIAMLRDIEARCYREGIAKPSAIIAHDRHRAFEPVTLRGMSSAVCPCWQLSTHYGHKWPFRDVNIGGLIWDTAANKIEVIRYEQAQHVRRVGSSAGR